MKKAGNKGRFPIVQKLHYCETAHVFESASSSLKPQLKVIESCHIIQVQNGLLYFMFVIAFK